jgi:regulatory factor X
VEKLYTPVLASALYELRKLAQNLETIMEQSMQNFSPEFCESKVEISVRAGHLLSRFADLYQVSSALAPILSDPEQVITMMHAWKKLDARSVADQCALSCDCKPEILADVMSNFSSWLVEAESMPSQGNKAIEKLGKWVEKVLESLQRNGVASRTLVPRVGFITSQVVRDFARVSPSSRIC